MPTIKIFGQRSGLKVIDEQTHFSPRIGSHSSLPVQIFVQKHVSVIVLAYLLKRYANLTSIYGNTIENAFSPGMGSHSSCSCIMLFEIT